MSEYVLWPVGLDDQHPHKAHEDVDIGLDVAVIEERTGVFRSELVGKGLTGLDRRLGDVGHPVHGIGVDGSVGVNGVRKVVRVEKDDAHPVALFDADGGTRHAGNRSHAPALGGEDPEFHELAGINLLGDLDHLQADGNFIRVAVAVEVAAQGDGGWGCPRDRRILEMLGPMAGDRKQGGKQAQPEGG